jgi:lactoylglutathione lyase
MSAGEAGAGDGDMSLTVLMIVNSQDRSRDFYHRVLAAQIVRDRDPVILRFHNCMIVLNVGGGPTSDKPAVTMAPPADRDTVSMALNIRVADIHAVYHAWRARGAEFLTPPQDRDGEIRCYLRDPDGYLIEVGQTTRA